MAKWLGCSHHKTELRISHSQFVKVIILDLENYPSMQHIQEVLENRAPQCDGSLLSEFRKTKDVWNYLMIVQK